jgi:hypothetical protein
MRSGVGQMTENHAANASSTPTEHTILPPKNNAQSDRQSNGTTQIMASRVHIDPNNYSESSAMMAEQTFNGDVEVAPSKAAALHVSNGIAAEKHKLSVLRFIEKSKSATIQRQLVKLMGLPKDEEEQFLRGIIPPTKQRQITADGPNGDRGDQPDQS